MSIVCPICHKYDEIQKISTIFIDDRFFLKRPLPFKVINSIRPPVKPFKLYTSGYLNVILWIFGLFTLVDSCIASTYIMFVLVSSAYENGKLANTPKIVVITLIIFIIMLALIFSLITTRVYYRLVRYIILRDKKKSEKTLDMDMLAWEKSYKTWDTLWICYRDIVVFDPQAEKQFTPDETPIYIKS